MILLGLALVFAILEWYAELKKQPMGIFLTKPTTMLFLIAWVFFFGQTFTFPLMWFGIGLAFSLAGDIFLMLPAERFFLPGLIAFLLGHVFYIIGFGRLVAPSSARVPGVIIALMLITVSILIYRKLAQGMQASGNRRMLIPVTVYSLVISIMLYAALITNLDNNWLAPNAILVSVGALLFYISDILNAWTRFVSPSPHDRLWIMISYHLGQFGIAMGVTLHFMS